MLGQHGTNAALGAGSCGRAGCLHQLPTTHRINRGDVIA
jgi:hypothetical protein